MVNNLFLVTEPAKSGAAFNLPDKEKPVLPPMRIMTTHAGKCLTLIQRIARPLQGMRLAADATHHMGALVQPFMAGQTHRIGLAVQEAGVIGGMGVMAYGAQPRPYRPVGKVARFEIFHLVDMAGVAQLGLLGLETVLVGHAVRFVAGAAGPDSGRAMH